jgi:hypothetical protein
VRAQATLALRGASGLPAWRHVVAALDDPAEPVWRAAVEALRSSAEADAARWAHATFHPNPAVRQAACSGAPVVSTEAFIFHLLADPACAPQAAAQLAGRRLPSYILPSLFDHYRRGVLTAAQTRAFILQMPWSEVFREMSRARMRSAEQVSDLLLAAGRDQEFPPDSLDELFDLFWDTDPPAGEGLDSAAQFFANVGKGVLAQNKEEMRRIVAALIVTGARRGFWIQPAADLCAGCYPEFFWFFWVARATRHQALRVLYVLGDRCPRRSDEFVSGLLLADLCQRPSGNLDLWAIGGLLHLLKKEPYKRLLSWLELEAVVAAFLEDIPYALPFLELTDNSDRGRSHLIAEIARRQPAGSTSLLAFLVHAGSADQLDFLDDLDGRRAVQLFAELLALRAAQPQLRLTESKQARLAEALGRRIAFASPEFLAVWLAVPAPEEFALGLRLLGVLAQRVEVREIIDAALALDLALLRKFLVVTAWSAGFSYGKEVQLALALADHADKDVRDWALVRVPTGAAPSAPEPTVPKESKLTPPEVSEIVTCTESELPEVLRRCLKQPRSGLCAALARRPDPSGPASSICVALLGALDPLDQVAQQLVRYGSEEAAFARELEEKVIRAWLPERKLPPQGHAWLFRWEQHGFAFADQFLSWPGGLVVALRFASSLRAALLRRRFWDAWTLTLCRWRWTDKPRLQQLFDEAFGNLLLEVLSTSEGEVVAQIFALWHVTLMNGPLLATLRPRVAHLLPVLAPPVLKTLADWIDTRGLMPAAPAHSTPVSAKIDEEIRRCSNLDQLEAWCAQDDVAQALEAGDRLVHLGENGVRRLARLLRRAPPPPAAAGLARTVLVWPKGPALREVRTLVQDTALDPEIRFRTGLALLERGDRQLLPHVLDAVCREAPRAWFRPEDWQRLLGFTNERSLALHLALSPQPAAYSPAVDHLIAHTPGDDAARRAMLAFLRAETPRLHELRLRAACWLHAQREFAGYPLLLQAAVVEQHALPLLVGLPADLVDATVTAVLTGGEPLASEGRLIDLAEMPLVSAETREHILSRLLLEATAPVVLQRVLGKLKCGAGRDRKLHTVATTFAWGVRIGRELTGRLFAVQMIAGDGLGYTRLEENKVYINALPLLRAEEDGRAVVEALILHELGHHLYHKGDEARSTWKQSEEEKLQPLLNLVSDEHLERNLRARAREFGDRLKKLCAYAFQHATREVAVHQLLAGLEGRAATVLTATRLGVARRRGCVAVESGTVLREMEKAGLSFPRFMRALRMGLGNRHADPRVAEALALFKGNFHRSSMPQMLEIARRLREIFGWEVQLLQALGADGVFGADPAEVLRVGEGLTDEELQEAIRRVLETGKADERERGGQVINVSPDEHFNTIPTVVRVPFDRAEYNRYAGEVKRHARQMRRFLLQLGVILEPQRFRLRGKRVDPTRLRDAILRGDPRLLVAREAQLRTDLFLGVLIDCSGSMQMNQKIEKAKLFGAMLAEAVRGLRGVELRLFGFTDSVIYDAGDAARCAVHGLRAAGGNNDAGALWHVAQVARASRRRAKLLVMISDGLPTECSVAALRALVGRLTHRWHFCCAQVAVQPLEEVLFPHYVVLDDADPDASVRRFGAIVARLVQKALG